MKKWEIEFTIKMIVTGPEEEAHAKFHFEENHCVGNLIRQLAEEYDANPNVCVHCGASEVKLLGDTIAAEWADMSGERK